MAKGGLGKGLSALIPGAGGRDQGIMVREIPLEDIDPSPFQPRERFDNNALDELAASIKVHGVLEPIILRSKGKRYEIIAGERRYKASKLAGLKTIPAIVKNYNDLKTMEIALVENLQREDLNPLEQANRHCLPSWAWQWLRFFSSGKISGSGISRFCTPKPQGVF